MRKVIIVAALFIIVLTIIIGLTTYFFETQKMDRRFEEIKQSYLDIIRTALWVDDKESLRTTLTGICRLPGIEYADIHSENKLICKAGQNTPAGKLHRFYPIIHTYNDKEYVLGELHLKGSSVYVREKIITAVIAIALTQALTTVIVCFLVFVLIHHIAIRRLINITAYASNFSLDSLTTPLVVDSNSHPPDELDRLSNAINHMRINMHEAFSRQKRLNTN